jgi:hypothetical protein
MSSSDTPHDVKAAPDEPAGEEKPGLPPAKPLRIDRTTENQSVRSNRNGAADESSAQLGAPLFRKLVAADEDLVGLVAYGLYKQNKYEWLAAFEKSCGRRPTADESNAYVLGEGTPRRLATYRQLAEAALAARSPNPEARLPARLIERQPVVDSLPRPGSALRQPNNSGAKAVPKGNRISAYYVAFMAALAILCVWLLVHFNVVKM